MAARLLGPVLAVAACLALTESAHACSRLPGYEQGQAVTLLCEEALPPAWTLVSLADDWVPTILSETPEHPQAYRARFVGLASERLGAGAGWSSARRDAHFELFGIFPSFSLLRARFADAERHACHARIDDQPLRTWDGSFGAGAEPSSGRVAALDTVRAHLICERLLRSGAGRARSDAALREALAVYQRRYMLPSLPELDAETRHALLTPSLELDFQALLRALRERVVDATGLIEDGSARQEWQQVLGRRIESAEYQQPLRAQPLPAGAPDHIARFTEAAAIALGWTSPERAATALRAQPPPRVAVRLPPLPAYHGPHMRLRAEIEGISPRRGASGGSSGARVPSDQRPTLTLFVATPGGEVPLVRWPTTVGGWKREKLPSGEEVRRFKASPLGRFEWREVLAAPTWFPPASTPDRELLRPVPGGGWAVDTEAVGPGYRSAYGLLALVHHRSSTAGDGSVRLIDTKIRTHGSGNFRSVLRGSSHGCHRLLNHLAIRLGGFLLAHVESVRHGQTEERYSRRLHHGGQSYALRASHRGYRFELLEPVPVDVVARPNPADDGPAMQGPEVQLLAPGPEVLPAADLESEGPC